jgi:serine protease Do
MVSAAVLGDSDSISVGEKTYAIGNANGEGISVTEGVVSVDSESIKMVSSDGLRTVKYRVMRTDAAINHGNSGGALFNAYGELIGITNAKNVKDETDNMGYALPITQVKSLVENMQANNGVVKRAWLGIQTLLTSSTAKLDESGKMVVEEEVTVATILADDKGAGYDKLKVGDILKSITIGTETKEITRDFMLNDMLLKLRKGDTATIKVVRDGKETSVELVFDQDGHFREYA